MEEEIAGPSGVTQYVMHDADGRILYGCTIPEWMASAQESCIPPGGGFVKGSGNPETDYVKDGVVVPRPSP